MEQKKSLAQLVGDTIVFTALSYPVYSAFSALGSPATFMEKLRDTPEIMPPVIGLGIGYFVVRGMQQLSRRYER